LSTLQLGLIVAGVLLVIGVIVYNQWQERRLKRRAAPAAPVDVRAPRAAERVEPTLAASALAPDAGDGVPAFRGGADTTSEFEPPIDVIAAPAYDGEALASDSHASIDTSPPVVHASLAPSRAQAARQASMPDHEIECLIPLQPAAPVAATAIAGGLNARIGKAVRWFGRADARSDWQRITATTPGSFGEIVACLLLADRNGAASRAQIDTFIRVVGDIAPTLPAAFTPPDVAQEVARAESLDRLCAELDVQIGLTVQKPESGSIAWDAASRCRRGGGISSGARRPLRTRKRGNGRGRLHAAEPATRSVHRGIAAADGDERRGVPARRRTDGRPGTHVRPDENGSQADGEDARRRARRR
jgi:hypothetical protein